MSHSHELVDGDLRFTIDPFTREISPKNHVKTKLMQGDHNSEIFTFEMPQFVEGHDMSQCNEIQVHYVNSGKPRRGEPDDYIGIDHITDIKTEDSKLIFTWTLSGACTRCEGTLSFCMKFICYNQDPEYSDSKIYEWNTEIFSNVKIAKTYDFTPV